MASASSSRETRPSVSSVTFPRARVYWSARIWRNEPRYAWICVSTSLHWIFIDSLDPAVQVDLSSFRGKYCLSLERLKDTAVWEDVEKVVVPFDNEGGPALFVHGELSYPDAWHAGRLSVKLNIVFDTTDERNTVMEQVRIRVSPWQLLYRRMKEARRDGKLSDKVLKDLLDWAESSTGTAEGHVSAKPFPFVDALEEGAKRGNVLAEFLQAAATIVKKSVENRAAALSQGAQDINEYVEGVTVVSSVVKILVIATKLVELYTEMKRGSKEWLDIHARVEDLFEVIVKRIMSILYLDGHVDEIVVMNTFEVQEELIDIVAIIEEKLMRGSGPIEVKKIEDELERQQLLWINDVQEKSIARNSKLLKDMERDLEELKKNTEPHAVQFERHFDCPYLPSNLVFDFESVDGDNRDITPESILLNSVLHPQLRGSLQGALALGTYGMGGVGKTTALKRICCAESVRGLFRDGVCFMEFGKNATLQKVREEIRRCIRNFGGKEVAKEMRRASSLIDAVNQAAEWLKDREVFLVFDDLWATDDSELGYVLELKQMLRDAPKSGLLISTRDRTIANAVSDSPVNFECAKPLGSRAREILGRVAFGYDWQQITSNWDCELEYVEILKVCAGLPLALGIAGSCVKLDYKDSKDASFSVKNYWSKLDRDVLNQLQSANTEYHVDGLKYVVEASLQSCEKWGFSRGRNIDIRRLFRSLCVLEKQQLIPESTLERYWGLDKQHVSEFVEKFTNLNIVKRDVLKRSTNYNSEVSQFYVYMHDLALALCQEMVVDEEEEEEWHLRLINTYRSTLEDDKEMETQPKDWWNVKDDGCVYENLSRHLVASGLSIELEALLCDVRWTLRRAEIGGWAALDLDFQRLLVYEGCSEKHRIRKLHSLLKHCWDWLRSDQSLFAFYVFGHLSKQERQERYVAEYLKTLIEHFPSPWLCPLTKCVGPEDRREQLRWNVKAEICDFSVSWFSDRVVIASAIGIHVRSLSRQEELFVIRIDKQDSVDCVVMSEDADMIVSGHEGGTVRRWNAHTGDAIGKPLSGHTKQVKSLAIRGNLIVSGSNDYRLYRWNATTGEAIGGALQGHEDGIFGLALSPDGKLIVSGSWDGTIRVWDAVSGKPGSSFTQGHSEGVTCLAISSDGKFILSGSQDETIRRWMANTGEAIGEPLRGHQDWVNRVAISESGKCIVSCSDDFDVRLWDAESGEGIGLPLRGHNDWVTAVAINRDGTLVLSGSLDGTIRLWDGSIQGSISQQNQFSEVSEFGIGSSRKQIFCVAVTPNGKLAVSGSSDGTVQRWDVLTGEAIGSPMLGHKEESGVYCVAVSSDSTLIVSGDGHGMVRRWDASTGEAIGDPMDGHSDLVNALVIDDNGELIVTGSKDGTIRRWRARTGEAIGIPMRGSKDGTIRRWKARTGEAIGIPMEDHSDWVSTLAVSTDGSLIVSGSDGSLRRWDARTGEQIGDDIKVPGPAENLVISNDGETIACGSFRSDYVQKFDIVTSKPMCEPMKWSEGEHMLEEMERARLYGDQEGDAIVRKDTFPIEVGCRAVCPDEKKIVLGLTNGNVVVCERR